MEQRTYRSANEANQRGAILLAAVEKRNIPTNEHVQTVLQALAQWGAKGNAAIQLDIPRKLWMEKLANAGQNPEIATNSYFTVGHIHVAPSADAERVRAHLRQLCKQFGFILLFETIRPSADESALFWQIAMLPGDVFSLSDRLFRLTAAMEREPHVRVASLGHTHVIYQAYTLADLLREPDISHPFFASAASFAYANGAESFFCHQRLGSAGMLVHCGEMSVGAVETLIYDHGYSLLEAAGAAFWPDTAKRHSLPSIGQLPACLAASFEQEAVWVAGTAGALWKTDDSSRVFIASRPQGGHAEPLAPGQPLALIRSTTGRTQWLNGDHFLQEMAIRLSNRRDAHAPIAF
ncbi:glutamate synthase [Geobacillus sp. Manikaran-105]|uniref:glutamate synthase n=1 Tax=Geobacillus sp. Manikaran-105 TaxID=2055940 RepID=UPI000C2879C6|nr:glutamate synthase [Geobacillus sp. Manikaran-105]PJW13350.1 glutamate synthase [Geobacillus sp. Manikaran-105]